ncbi:ABC-2 type transport system permease protein [Garicola koreensis]|uniref:ABC-2 type transport system permease protein n=1 Tax=Garicola koreensis TaxID=1262554 RepID=A0A7W5Y088_9MICC|nr:ABC-2 type transport system permease protein [Garicola koreensis]
MSELTSASPRPRSRPAPALQRVLAHGRYETRNTLRNGEQLLVTLILPLLVLIGVHRLDLISSATGGIDALVPGVLALAVMASAFTGQGIATGFDRQYGVLAYLATTPLGPTGLILGKAVAVLSVIMVQLVVLGAAGLTLGWSPDPLGLVWLLAVLVLGAAAFTALGLLLAGTVRAEATLAVTNVAWVLLGAAGGTIFALDHQGPGVLLLLLPSAALGEAARAAAADGVFAVVPVLILASWAVLALLAARRWFRWR